MEQFITHLTELFRQRWHDDRIQLKVSEVNPGSRRVGGYMVWSGFQNQSQYDRQNQVWSLLRGELSLAEQQQVSAILTLTPLEEEGILANE